MKYLMLLLSLALTTVVIAQVKKVAPPLIREGTVLVYSLGEDATLIVKITSLKSGVAYDYTIIDGDDKPKNGSVAHTARHLQKLDTLAGFRHVYEGFANPDMEMNYLTLWISTEAFKKMQKSNVSFQIEMDDAVKFTKGGEPGFDLNVHEKYLGSDTAFMQYKEYVHGKKLQLRSVNLTNDDSTASVEVWNNPAQPLILYYSLPGIGELRLLAIL